MSFRIRGLEPEPFAPLFALDDEALAAKGMRRMVCDAPRSAPCRVTLEDAEPGERLLLLAYEHQPAADSPFRASGPIFVRENAEAAYDRVDEIPPAILARPTISLRAYDHQAMMIDAALAPGVEVSQILENWLARPEVDTVHLHYALRGCYAARADRI